MRPTRLTLGATGTPQAKNYAAVINVSRLQHLSLANTERNGDLQYWSDLISRSSETLIHLALRSYPHGPWRPNMNIPAIQLPSLKTYCCATSKNRLEDTFESFCVIDAPQLQDLCLHTDDSALAERLFQKYADQLHHIDFGTHQRMELAKLRDYLQTSTPCLFTIGRS